MFQKKERSFVSKDAKKHIIILGIVLFAAIILIAIISLLPNRMPQLGNTDRNGVARNFLFPFVFTTEDGRLYVADSDRTVTEIDDTVTKASHDTAKGKIYYLRENSLYEYDMKSNTRVMLTENVTRYSLLEDRSAILCIEREGALKLYRHKAGAAVTLTEESLVNNVGAVNVVMGKEHILFLDHMDQETSTADLICSDANGKTKVIAENINAAKGFYIGADDKFICYYTAEDLVIAEIDGTPVKQLSAAQLVRQQQQPTLYAASTEIVITSDHVPLRYFLCNINSDATRTVSASMVYFNDAKLIDIADSVKQVIYYSGEDNYVIYSTETEKGTAVFMSSRGEPGRKILDCGADTKFIFDQELNYLYYQNASGLLCRVNVYDVNLKQEMVAEGTGNLYHYPNKPIIMYEDTERIYAYYVLKNNTIERSSSETEKRLYGRDDDIYLLCRTHSSNKLSLDIVKENAMTRISGDVEQSVFFDKNMESVLYTSGGILYVWQNGAVSELGTFTGVKAAALIGGS